MARADAFDTIRAGRDAADVQRSQLRFITCGSVDDGKSTLVGRILYDCRLIAEDQLAAVAIASRKFGTVGDDIDLALLADGLEAEREQGITIDVAYRFFATARRSFVVADTPGHEQFTRNMATGASTAELAVILVDATKGLTVQSRRHTIICALLGVRHIVLAVNKIDAIEEIEAVYAAITAEYRAFVRALELASFTAIPISARFGDNVSFRSLRTPFYSGPTLIEHLETVDCSSDALNRPFRMPVQWVNRPNSEFRALAGQVASGSISVGDPVVVARLGQASTVRRIATFDGDLDVAHAGDAVNIVLADDIDVARGDVLAPPDARPHCADQFAAHVIWMSETPLLPGRSYGLMCGPNEVPARITSIKHKIAINTLDHQSAKVLTLNEVGACHIATGSPIAFDPFNERRGTGAFIIVDRETNATAGAGMIDFPLRRAQNIHRQSHTVERASREAAKHQTARCIWFTGLSGSGKSTISDIVERELHDRGYHTMLLDGDNMRHGLNSDLGFTDADRVENIRRVGEVAKLMVEAGLIVICSFISPFTAEREMVHNLIGQDRFIEVFVDTPLEDCIARDPKGLYRKALAGEIPRFTGVSSPYERPENPDIRIDGRSESAAAAAERITVWLVRADAMDASLGTEVSDTTRAGESSP